MLNPSYPDNIQYEQPGFNGIPNFVYPTPIGTTVVAQAVTGTEMCPRCWRVWSWASPLPGQYSPCPRCGQTMPVGAETLYRMPDEEGFPSE